MAVVGAGARRPRGDAAAHVLLAVSLIAVGMMVLSVDVAAPVRALSRVPDWRLPLAAAETALAAGDTSAALAAWREARRRASQAGSWEGLLDVGAAYRRLGAAVGAARDADAAARELFLAAAFRARADGALEGVLGAADAFAALGDHEVFVGCLRMAETLAGTDRAARARIRATAARWGIRAEGVLQ